MKREPTQRLMEQSLNPRNKDEAHKVLDEGIDVILKPYAHELLDHYYLRDPQNNEPLMLKKKVMLDWLADQLSASTRLCDLMQPLVPAYLRIREKGKTSNSGDQSTQP